MPSDDFEIFRDTILTSFKKRGTAFLMEDKILKDIGFQKAINPKEDKARLDSILELMREQGLVLTNQPKFVALTPAGKSAMEALSPERIAEIERELEARLK